MAKRASSDTQQKIEDFAEDLGKMLGSARAKAEGWLSQRQAIVKNLTDLRDTASQLLSELGQKAHDAARRGRKAGRAAAAEVGTIKRGPGRPVGSSRKKKRTMSAAARAAISRAQKARWARQKAAEKTK